MRLNTYRLDPEGNKRLLAWNHHLVGSGLSPAFRALVETRVSQINGCGFCLAMRAEEARQAHVPRARLDVVAAWRDWTSFTPEERAALASAEAMTRLADGPRVSDDIWPPHSASMRPGFPPWSRSWGDGCITWLAGHPDGFVLAASATPSPTTTSSSTPPPA